MLRYFATVLLALVLGVMSYGDAQAQASYPLKPGDTASFQVVEDPLLNRNLLILLYGTVSILNIGVVNASGQTLTSLTEALTQRLSPLFAQPPNVFLSVASLAPPPIQQFAPATPPEEPTIAVYALGEFKAPDQFEVDPGTTLLQCFAVAEGDVTIAPEPRLFE